MVLPEIGKTPMESGAGSPDVCLCNVFFAVTAALCNGAGSGKTSDLDIKETFPQAKIGANFCKVVLLQALGLDESRADKT